MRMLLISLFLLLFVSPLAAEELIVDGDFSATPNGATLRRDDKGQDWHESRRDSKEARKLLMLSEKKIGGNATKKAIIKGDLKHNTYLTQRFSSPQKGKLSIEYRVYVREIFPDDNRSAFCMVGTNRDGKNGPNSTGNERFVFLGFENAEQEGKINLFAREGKKKWDDRTIVAANLDLKKWYTIEVVVDAKDKSYEVEVKDVTEPVKLKAFGSKPPKELSHISFASWNDGAGTFYVDDVSASKE